MKIKDLKFEPIWVFISLFAYGLIRIIEYTTGQKGTPEWVVDFFPYIITFLLILFDNVFGGEDE